MSNVDRPFGARVVRSGSASPYNARVTQYHADASRSTTSGFGNIYAGDFVTLEADGNVAPAVSGDTILGVVVAAGPSGDTDHGRTGPWNADNLEERFLAADEAGYVHVIDDPDVLIAIQEDADSDGAALGESDIGSSFDITAAAGTSHGSDLSGESTVEIDSDGTVNGDVILLGLVDKPDNDYGAHAEWLVRIVNHQF